MTTTELTPTNNKKVPTFRSGSDNSRIFGYLKGKKKYVAKNDVLDLMRSYGASDAVTSRRLRGLVASAIIEKKYIKASDSYQYRAAR